MQVKLLFYLKNGLTEQVKINSDKKKIQVQVGSLFYGYYDIDKIAELISRSYIENGLNIDLLFNEYIEANSRGTEKLTSQTFSRHLKSLMEFYKVEAVRTRRTVNQKKETRYVFKSTSSVEIELIIALNQMRMPNRKSKQYENLNSEVDDFLKLA